MEKKEDKNIIKNLSYVSKINKNIKENKVLFQELMRNLKISFQEEKCNIKYDEYYFNGIPIPKNIEFKDVSSDSLNITWKIDNLNINNIDNNKIKFRVEMRKNNEKFIQVYEGNNNNFNVKNLNKKTIYEFRICSFYNDVISSLSQIQKIETLDFKCDSNILLESKNEKKYLEIIKNWCGYKKLELLYRGSRDGSTSKAFHDNVIIKDQL